MKTRYKKAKRILTFYSNHFGYKPPYHVLVSIQYFLSKNKIWFCIIVIRWNVKATSETIFSSGLSIVILQPDQWEQKQLNHLKDSFWDKDCHFCQRLQLFSFLRILVVFAKLCTLFCDPSSQAIAACIDYRCVQIEMIMSLTFLAWPMMWGLHVSHGGLSMQRNFLHSILLEWKRGMIAFFSFD